MRKRKKRALPKLTLLAYGEKELLRFSEAVEGTVGMLSTVRNMLQEFGVLVEQLERAAQVIERRHNAAVKANQTRKDQASGKAPVAEPTAYQLDAMRDADGFTPAGAVVDFTAGNTDCPQ